MIFWPRCDGSTRASRTEIRCQLDAFSGGRSPWNLAGVPKSLVLVQADVGRSEAWAWPTGRNVPDCVSDVEPQAADVVADGREAACFGHPEGHATRRSAVTRGDIHTGNKSCFSVIVSGRLALERCLNEIMACVLEPGPNAGAGLARDAVR